MARARNMQSLTDDIEARHPGVVIYGIGNKDHQQHASGHNEDDTPGSKPEQTDADDDPEHRAIDVMLGPSLSRSEAQQLVDDLLADPAALARLLYVIFDGYIWSAAYGWVRRPYTGKDKHTGHIHISGEADDDENAASWPAVTGDDMPYSKSDLQAFPWQYSGGGIGENVSGNVGGKNRSMLSYINESLLLMRQIALKVDIDEQELAAIETRAQAGVRAALEDSAERFVDAIVAGILDNLPDEVPTVEAIRQAADLAVRNVLLHGAATNSEVAD